MFTGSISVPTWEADYRGLGSTSNDGHLLPRGTKYFDEIEQKILNYIFSCALKKVDSNAFLNFKPLVPITLIFACKYW